MESEISQIPEVFQRLISNPSQFEELGKILKSKQIQSVLVLARGTSDNAAHFLKYLIEVKLGLPVGLTSPSSVTIYKTKLNFEQTLVVALSQSGQSTDLIEYAKAVRSTPALLVAITNDSKSPLAQLAEFHIDLMAGTEIAVAATKSYAAELLASLMLVNKWANLKVDLAELVVQAADLIKNVSEISKVVDLVTTKAELVCIGRGFSYPNAKEAALKIQETSKISVQGYSIADYMHGPISALTNKTQVIIFAPSGLPKSAILDSVEKIRAVGPKIFWCGTSEFASNHEVVLSGSNCSDEIKSSVVDAIILQQFALELARKNGLDPDNPAGLNKVTLTK
jgi:glutamine---fructose-6-phosphate transaminase (isomerizing)